MRATQLVELVAAILATILNLILIPIIVTKSSIRMGAYKYFLLAYTITAAIYSYCVSTALFTWFLPKNGFLFICTAETFPRWFEGVQMMLFDVCYLNTIIILVGSFIYRLYALQNASHSITKRRFITLTIAALTFPNILTIGCFMYMTPSEKSEKAFREEVLIELGLDLSTVFYVGGPFTIDGHLNLQMILLLAMITVIFTTGIIICNVCWFRIGSKLKELRILTNSSYKYHHNFYILLTLQACLPLVFYAVPITILIIMGITQVSIDGFSYICGMCLSFAQVLDPLLIIYFISDYKRFLLRKKAHMLNYLGITSHSVHIFNSGSTGIIRP